MSHPPQWTVALLVCGLSTALAACLCGQQIDGFGDGGQNGSRDSGLVCSPELASFGGALPIPTMRSADIFTSGDFNQDGLADLAISSLPSPSQIAIYYGLLDGGFTLGQTLEVYDFRLVVADLNGDGRLDILGAGFDGLDVMINQPGDTFVLHPITGAPSTNAVSVADLDGDGRADIATCDESGLRILFDEGEPVDGIPAFRPGVTVSTDSCGSLIATRLTSDGPASLISDSPSGAMVVRLGIGDGGFLPVSTYQSAESEILSFATLDINLDGLTDIAAATRSGLVVYTNVDGGAFSVGAPLSPLAYPSPYLAALAVLDVNADGFPDIVADGLGIDPCTPLAYPVLFQNDCAGGFQSAVALGGEGVVEAADLGALILPGGAPGILVEDECANQLLVIPATEPSGR